MVSDVTHHVTLRSLELGVCEISTREYDVVVLVVSLRDFIINFFLDHVSCQFDRSRCDHECGVVTQHIVTRVWDFVLVTHDVWYS